MVLSGITVPGSTSEFTTALFFPIFAPLPIRSGNNRLVFQHYVVLNNGWLFTGTATKTTGPRRVQSNLFRRSRYHHRNGLFFQRVEDHTVIHAGDVADGKRLTFVGPDGYFAAQPLHEFIG